MPPFFVLECAPPQRMERRASTPLTIASVKYSYNKEVLKNTNVVIGTYMDDVSFPPENEKGEMLSSLFVKDIERLSKESYLKYDVRECGTMSYLNEGNYQIVEYETEKGVYRLIVNKMDVEMVRCLSLSLSLCLARCSLVCENPCVHSLLAAHILLLCLP